MKKSKLEKIMTTIPITIVFVIVGLIVLNIFYPILNTFMVDVLIILGIICFGCISVLPATRILTKETNKNRHIWAYIIIGLTSLTCLLWIIFVFVGQNFINGVVNDTLDTGLEDIWNYTKIVIFITILTSLFNLIISNVFTFKKEYFAFQIIMYISNFIVALWFSIVVLSIVPGTDDFILTAQWLISSKPIWAIFVLSLAFSILASAIMKSIIKKRTRDITLDKQTILKTVNDNTETPQLEKQDNSIEQRLKRLENLKNSGMITEEEYTSKKSKILEEL